MTRLSKAGIQSALFVDDIVTATRQYLAVLRRGVGVGFVFQQPLAKSMSRFHGHHQLGLAQFAVRTCPCQALVDGPISPASRSCIVLLVQNPSMPNDPSLRMGHSQSEGSSRASFHRQTDRLFIPMPNGIRIVISKAFCTSFENPSISSLGPSPHCSIHLFIINSHHGIDLLGGHVTPGSGVMLLPPLLSMLSADSGDELARMEILTVNPALFVWFTCAPLSISSSKSSCFHPISKM